MRISIKAVTNDREVDLVLLLTVEMFHIQAVRFVGFYFHYACTLSYEGYGEGSINHYFQ